MCTAQVLPRSQLPLLMSIMMITQAFLAAPAGLAAKKSLGDRNRMILLGYAAMIGADLAFAFFTTPLGGPDRPHVSLVASPLWPPSLFAPVRKAPRLLVRQRHGRVARISMQWQSVHHQCAALVAAGMYAAAALVGVHMALTHGVTLAMVASYIPTTEVPGIGKVSGTCWSFTDFIFGAAPPRGPSSDPLCCSCSCCMHRNHRIRCARPARPDLSSRPPALQR